MDIRNSLGLLNNDVNRVMYNMNMGGLGMDVGELDIGDLQTSVGDGSDKKTLATTSTTLVEAWRLQQEKL